MAKRIRLSRLSTLCGAVAAVLFAAAGAAQPGAQPLAPNASVPHERPGPSEALRLAVPEFAGNGSAEELGFLRGALPTLLRVSLLAQPGIAFVEGTAPVGGPLSPEEAMARGADFLLEGSFFYYEGSIRLDAEVRDLRGSGKASLSSSVVALEDLYAAVGELAADLRKNLPELRRNSGAKRIAVSCFANATEPKTEQQGWIGASLGKYLSTNLLAGEDVTVLPWDETKQGCSDNGSPRRPRALFAELAADALLLGRFEISGQEVTVFPELTLADGGIRLSFPAVTGSVFRMEDLEDLVTEDAQALLRILLQGKTWRLEPFAGEIGLEEAAARATALLQRGEDLPLALWLFHRVKELAPDDPRGHAGVGACRLAGGRYGQALRELSRAAEIAPERADVRQLLGDVYLKLNRLDDALKAYRQAADLAPNVYEYPLKLGVALQLDGKYAEALAVLGTAAEKGAPAADVHVAMANVLRSSGNAERAAEEYRLALAAKPDSREARLGLSEVLVAQAAPSIVKRDFDAALKLLREAQDLSPSALGYARLALIFTETQRYEEAVRVTEEAERAGLGTAPVFHNRAFALARLGRRDEALKAYDAALQLQPESATTLLNKANLLTQMNRAPEARALLARVRADRINLETRVRIATVLARLEEYPAALAELDAVLKLDPKSVLALNAKAFVFNRIGRYDEAVAVLDDALRLDRANDGLYTNRAYALAELGRHEDAIAAADRALAINSQSAAALSHKGYSLYLLGKSEEGLELIREAAALDPAYGGSRYNLARVHVRQGHNEETLADLAAAFDLDPRFRTLALEAPEFAALRLDPGFRRLLARFQTPDSANPMTPASPESSNGPG